VSTTTDPSIFAHCDRKGTDLWFFAELHPLSQCYVIPR
jgi:hypothetical protein